MRLSQNYIDIIKSTLAAKVSDAEVFLFGSRVDDTKKGGDIDLFVSTSQNITLRDELSILVDLEIKGITRKIDLIVDSPRKNKKAFFNTIKEKAILL